jgi:hypothetical protein
VAHLVGRPHGTHLAQCAYGPPRAASCFNGRHTKNLLGKDFRTRIARSLKNRMVRRFLEMEYEKFTPSYRVDAAAPIQNKVGAFPADPMLDRMLSFPKRELRVRQVMDKAQVLIVNLAKGRIGDDSSSLLGGLLVTTIGLAAYTSGLATG